jgi:hypothetical protein
MAYPQYQRPFPSSRELTCGDPFLELRRGMNRMFDDVFRSSLWPLTAAQQVGSMMAPVRAGAEEQRRQAPDRQQQPKQAAGAGNKPQPESQSPSTQSSAESSPSSQKVGRSDSPRRQSQPA